MAVYSERLSFVAEPLPDLAGLRFVKAIGTEVRSQLPGANIAFLARAEELQMAKAVDWQMLE